MTVTETSMPGPLDALDKQRPDEPRFVLLGRDPDAPAGIAGWADSRRKRMDLAQYGEHNQMPPEVRDELVQISEAEIVAAEMVRYRLKHPELDSTTARRATISDATAAKALSDREKLMRCLKHMREAAYHTRESLDGLQPLGVLEIDQIAALDEALRTINTIADAITPRRGA